MPMQLFEHNRIAYEAAVRMLSERGKAAVIHPTGKGKSFIGFKLCEDYPGKTICWLSPSRYIYQTQLETLAETPEGYALGSWLMTQRRVYKGEVNGNLTQVQIDRLNSIGMR